MKVFAMAPMTDVLGGTYTKHYLADSQLTQTNRESGAAKSPGSPR